MAWIAPVARSDAVPGLVREGGRAVVLDDEELQPVLKLELLDFEIRTALKGGPVTSAGSAGASDADFFRRTARGRGERHRQKNFRQRGSRQKHFRWDIFRRDEFHGVLH